MKANGEVLQFKEGFALAEFYPAHIRASLSHGGGLPQKRTKKPAKKAKPAQKPLVLPQKARTASGGLYQLPQGRVDYFRDVMSALPDISRQAAASTLGKLAKDRGWDKSEDGKYRVGA